MSTSNFRHLIFDKEAKNKLEKRKLLQQMVLRKIGCPYCRRMKLDPLSITLHKTLTANESKTKPEALKPLEENRQCLCGAGIRKDFLNSTPFSSRLKANNRWNLIKVKNFCTAKENKQVKGSPKNGGGMSTTYTSDRVLVSRTYKELKKTESKTKQMTHSKNGPGIRMESSQKKRGVGKTTEKYLLKCSSSLAIREM